MEFPPYSNYNIFVVRQHESRYVCPQPEAGYADKQSIVQDQGLGLSV